MSKIFNTDYGRVEVRPAMFDIDGTTLEEGIEIKGEGLGLIELHGYRDISDLVLEEVEDIIHSVT